MLEALPATVGMARELAEINIRSWQAAYQGIIPDDFLRGLSADARISMVEARIRQSADRYLLFRVGGQSAGMALYRCVPDDTPEQGEVVAFYFLPGYWGQGYASAAMTACFDALRDMGCAQVTVRVLSENLRARRFYEKMGFADTGEEVEIVIGKPLLERSYSRAI